MPTPVYGRAKLVHGLLGTYANHGCRCAKCTTACRAYHRQYRRQFGVPGRNIPATMTKATASRAGIAPTPETPEKRAKLLARISAFRYPARVTTCRACGNQAMQQSARASHCVMCGRTYWSEG